MDLAWEVDDMVKDTGFARRKSELSISVSSLA
jgi:hypothetical protein